MTTSSLPTPGSLPHLQIAIAERPMHNPDKVHGELVLKHRKIARWARVLLVDTPVRAWQTPLPLLLQWGRQFLLTHSTWLRTQLMTLQALVGLFFFLHTPPVHSEWQYFSQTPPQEGNWWSHWAILRIHAAGRVGMIPNREVHDLL